MNILILTGRFGLGHYSAANTLSQQLKSRYPQVQVTVWDIFEFISPSHYRDFYEGYTKLVSKASGLYNWYYQAGEKKKKNRKPPMMLYLFRVLEQMLEQTHPDVIFSTLPLCSQLVNWYQEIHYLPVPLVTCITDITVHNEWINDNTAYYLVGSETLKQQLQEKGVEGRRIYPSGIPVRQAFKEAHPHWGSDKRQLLIMGGGLGLIPDDPRFFEQLNRMRDVHTTVIAGNNQKLYQKLHGKYENIQVVGFTEQVHEYMQKADVLLSKPGGITMFEAIYSELPMLVIHPFLQQEKKNAHFLEQQNLGKVVWDSQKQVIGQIEEFLHDYESLSLIRQSMADFRSGLQDNALECIMERIGAQTDRFFWPGMAGDAQDGFFRKGVALL